MTDKSKSGWNQSAGTRFMRFDGAIAERFGFVCSESREGALNSIKEKHQWEESFEVGIIYDGWAKW